MAPLAPAVKKTSEEGDGRAEGDSAETGTIQARSDRLDHAIEIDRLRLVRVEAGVEGAPLLAREDVRRRRQRDDRGARQGRTGIVEATAKGNALLDRFAHCLETSPDFVSGFTRQWTRKRFPETSDLFFSKRSRGRKIIVAVFSQVRGSVIVEC